MKDKMPYGKHKGSTISHIFQWYRKYMYWIVTTKTKFSKEVYDEVDRLKKWDESVEKHHASSPNYKKSNRTSNIKNDYWSNNRDEDSLYADAYEWGSQ